VSAPLVRTAIVKISSAPRWASPVVFLHDSHDQQRSTATGVVILVHGAGVTMLVTRTRFWRQFPAGVT
jgi:hypothetical protein